MRRSKATSPRRRRRKAVFTKQQRNAPRRPAETHHTRRALGADNTMRTSARWLRGATPTDCLGTRPAKREQGVPLPVPLSCLHIPRPLRALFGRTTSSTSGATILPCCSGGWWGRKAACVLSQQSKVKGCASAVYNSARFPIQPLAVKLHTPLQTIHN